ncbi:hypothetical protein ACLI4Z_12965 [Natrialbaceae archaeon A-arb3/5]
MSQDSGLDRALQNSRLYGRVTETRDEPEAESEPAASAARSSVTNSRLYGWLATAWQWGSSSTIARLLNDQRVLFGGVVAFVLVSLVRILLSGLHVTVRFLSFALLAVVLLVLVWPYTEPLSDR